MPPPRPTYSVIRVPPSDARADLLRLWSENLHLESTPAAKYDWLYTTAPNPPDTVVLLRASDSTTAVGTAGVGVRHFQIGASHPSASAGLLADLAVDKAHRSVGPALALVRETKAYALATHGFAYGFPNHLAEGVFKRVGYVTLGTIGRWARVLRHAEYASRVRELELARVPPAARELLYRAVEQPLFAAMAGAAVDLAQLARRSPAAAEASRRLRVDATATPPVAALDALWEGSRGDHGVVAHRTGAVLAWRFPSSAKRTWYTAYARGGSSHAAELRVYALVERSDDGTAHIRDLFGHRADMPAMLDLLPGLVYRTGATSLSMRYLGGQWLAESLESRGFAPRESKRMIAVAAAEHLDPGLAAQVHSPEGWHLTDFDEDA